MLMRSAIRLARDVAASTRLAPQQRRRWIALLKRRRPLYCPEIGRQADVLLDRRVRRANDGYLVRVAIRDRHHCRVLWIKWLPAADPAVMELTLNRMRWWQDQHPQLRGPVAALRDFWPGENVLLIEGRPGVALNKRLRPGAQDGANGDTDDLEQAASGLGAWLRAFARGRETYDETVHPMLGAQATRSSDGRLLADALRLLELRIELARQAAHELYRSGLTQAAKWPERFDLDGILGEFRDRQPGGFIHGDFNTHNILIDGRAFAVIDWWTTPYVSWPLPDVATLGGNLWLEGRSERARAVWTRFAESYFPDGPDERTGRVLDLLGTVMCLGFLARKVADPKSRMVSRSWCEQMLDRLTAEHAMIGGMNDG
jgi:hypothetical protein